tara:strand:- start:527 stop:877 length:351 start_codon:yes stop_codon:yes gene_type:complete
MYTKKYQNRNKYKAVKQKFNGRTYHSKKEAQYAAELEWRLKAKEIVEYIPQFPLRLYVNEKKICNYFIDFKVIYPDGSIELVEVKGFETDVWRLKWKLTEALLNDLEPNAKLVLVK